MTTPTWKLFSFPQILPLIQPLDQGIMKAFKSQYPSELFFFFFNKWTLYQDFGGSQSQQGNYHDGLLEISHCTWGDWLCWQHQAGDHQLLLEKCLTRLRGEFRRLWRCCRRYKQQCQKHNAYHMQIGEGFGDMRKMWRKLWQRKQ